MSYIFEKYGSINDVHVNIECGDTEPSNTSALWVKQRFGGRVYFDLFPDPPAIIADLPTERSYCASAAVGSKIYLFGGFTAHEVEGQPNTYTYEYHSSILMFDTESETISELQAKLPLEADSISAAVLGTKIYLFGGVFWEYKKGRTYRDNIFVFDTESETISELQVKLPTASYGIASAAVGSKIYLIGGYVDDIYRNTTDNIYVFDADEETVTYVRALAQRDAYVGAVSVGNKIYCSCRNSDDIIKLYVLDTDSRSLVWQTTTDYDGGNIYASLVGHNIYWFNSYKSAGMYVQDAATGITRFMPVNIRGGTYSASTGKGSDIYMFNSNHVLKFSPTVDAEPGSIILYTGGELLSNEPIAHTPLFVDGNTTIDVYSGWVDVVDNNGLPTAADAYTYVDGSWTSIYSWFDS